MSKISEQLLKYAQEEKQAHEEYIRDFAASTMAHLINGGVDKEKASLLAKEACLKDENLVKSISRANILEKTAQYIVALEEENVKLAAQVETDKEKEPELPAALKKFAEWGYSKEEIEALSGMPDKVLEKMANNFGRPDEMGRPSGVPGRSSDPLLDFILS